MTYVGTRTPPTPITGQIRFNEAMHTIETFDGTSWIIMAVAPHTMDDENSVDIDIGFDLYGECGYWVSVKPRGEKEYIYQVNTDVFTWATETYGFDPTGGWGNGRWTASDGRYYFRNERDRDWMVMKWSGHGNS